MGTIGIIGGGITGLTAAYSLQKAGQPVTVYEASAQVGGQIRTSRQGDWLVENGPNTVRLNKPELVNLLQDLGLDQEVVYPPSAARNRYIVRGGDLNPLPMGIRSLLKSQLLSWSSKMRILTEPFRKPKLPPQDEPLAQMLGRQLSPEIIEYIVGPFTGGVFASSPEYLSAQYAFPQLYHSLQEQGSLIKGQKAEAKRKKQAGEPVPAPIFSFPGGQQRLPEQIAAKLGDQLKLNTAISSIEQTEVQWAVTTRQGDTHYHDALVITTPAYNLPNLNQELFQPKLFQKVHYPPLSVVSLGFPRAAVAHPLDGFGVLVPESEPYSILGALFPSSLFPGRAPQDQVLFTCFLGGTRAPGHAELPEEKQIALVKSDLHALLGVEGEPSFQQLYTWPQAIPLYHIGYGRFLQQLQDFEAHNPGLHLAGSYRGGIGLPDRVAAGYKIAQKLISS